MEAEKVLFPDGHVIPWVRPCDHYAGNEKFILKAFSLQRQIGPKFDITCDLEDGAPIGDEAKQRSLICEILASSENNYKACGVRIHSCDSPHFRTDLEEIISKIGDRIEYITVPKISNAAEAEGVLSIVSNASRDSGLSTPVPIHFLIETPRALHEVWTIASLKGVRGLDFGIMDFVSAHQGAIPSSCMESPDQFTNPLIVRAKTDIVLAAIGNGVIPVHNVTTNYKDLSIIANDAKIARTQFGFLRMWSIHPDQIEPMISAFTPSYTEIAKAREIISLAQSSNWGPVSHDGILHDRASYRYYWGLLKAASESLS